MKIDTLPHGMVAVVVPHGPLVTDDVDDLHRAVQAAGERRNGRVVVDLSDVPYLDSKGIEALLELHTAGRVAAAAPKLASLTETCREALNLTDVLPRLEVFDTVENALRSYNR